MDFISKQVIEELSETRGISFIRMKAIQDAPYRFLRDVMSNKVDRENSVFPSVRILGLGIFHVPEYVIKKFKSLKKSR